jgi:hypothetical protein
LYSSQIIIPVVKSKELGGACRTHATYKISVGKPKGKDHLGDLDVDRRTIIKVKLSLY